MKTDDMPAGRTMDALVAEKVVGWKKRYCSCSDGVCGDMWFPPDDDCGCGYSEISLPSYSSDIAAAWEVDCAIAQQEGHIQLGYVQALHILLGIPSNTVLNVGQELKLIRATPEQRCKAALKAMGVEEA